MFNFKFRIMIKSCKRLIKYFSGRKFINYALAKFDTQDNVMEYTWGNGWEQNYDWDNDTFFKPFGLKRISDTKLRVECTENAKRIRLNKFNYPYKVTKFSDNYFEIHCSKLQKYFDDTDIIEVLFELK